MSLERIQAFDLAGAFSGFASYMGLRQTSKDSQHIINNAETSTWNSNALLQLISMKYSKDNFISDMKKLAFFYLLITLLLKNNLLPSSLLK